MKAFSLEEHESIMKYFKKKYDNTDDLTLF